MPTGLTFSGDRSETEAVSIGNNYNPVTVTMQGGESLAERYSRLAQETPDRRLVDFELRALDVAPLDPVPRDHVPDRGHDRGRRSCSRPGGRSSTAASASAAAGASSR